MAFTSGCFFNEVSLAGFMRGKKLTPEYFQTFINDYYKAKHWNEKGEPGKDIMEECNI